MPGMAREKGLHFDAILFPSNVMDRRFVSEVIPVLRREWITVQPGSRWAGKSFWKAKL